MDNHTLEQRKKNMRAIKCNNTRIEILLRKALWRRGLRYRKNVKSIFGHPDIAFIKNKVAVFCDSEFWHGYDWENAKVKIQTRREFWIPKIERNIQRDLQVTHCLEQDGWVVLRFWGKEIIKDPNKCAEIIEATLKANQ